MKPLSLSRRKSPLGLPLKPHSRYSRGNQHRQDGGNYVENAQVELTRYKAEASRMARCLIRAQKLILKPKKKEVRRIKRLNQLGVELIKHVDELVEEFLATAEAENNPNDLEAINIQNEEAIIRGMNDLNLDGDNTISAVDQVQCSCCSSSGSATDGNVYNEGGEVSSSSGGFGHGEGHE